MTTSETTAATTTVTTARPLVAGRYELREVAGRGGSATVHRATDHRDGRDVALKLFAPGVQGPDRLRQDRELTLLARLDHPGLVTLLDAGVDELGAFLVTEFVPGPTLLRRLRDGALPTEQVTTLGARLADALAHVHAAGITHRDVKPANVLLDADGAPLLADFGIALLIDTTRVTATDAVIGTAAYMAPEQLRHGDVGPAADVYALGLVLLEAVTGARAFGGTSAEAVLARLVAPPVVPDTVPTDLAALLSAMTADDPAARPTAAAVARVLADAADGRALPAPFSRGGRAAPVGGGRPRWWRRRPRRARAAAAAALAALLLGVLITTLLGVGGPTPPADPSSAAALPGAPVSRGAGPAVPATPTAPAGGGPTTGGGARPASPAADVPRRPAPGADTTPVGDAGPAGDDAAGDDAAGDDSAGDDSAGRDGSGRGGSGSGSGRDSGGDSSGSGRGDGGGRGGGDDG